MAVRVNAVWRVTAAICESDVACETIVRRMANMTVLDL